MGNIMKTLLLAIALSLAVVPSVTTHAQERMSPVPVDKLTAEQKKVLAEMGPRADSLLVGGGGRYLIRVPELMPLQRAAVDHIRFRSVLGQRLSEMVILMSIREWTQQFQWYNHSPMAKKAGLSAEVIDAIAEGRRPPKMAEDEEILYDFCAEVQRNNSVSDATYARARSKFGDEGIIEAVHIQGTYAYLARIFNVVRYPLPPGAKPELSPLPR